MCLAVGETLPVVTGPCGGSLERICASGIVKGDRFVMRDVSDLARYTPVGHVKAAYEAAREYGRQGKEGQR